MLASAVVVALLFTVSASAQVHGVPPSVTSLTPGFPISAPAPSVTSLGPAGFRGSGPLGFGSRIRYSNTFVPGFSRPLRSFNGRGRHPFASFSPFAATAPVYIPYVYPMYPVEEADVATDLAPTNAPRTIIIERDRPRYGEHYLDSRERQPSIPDPAPKPEVPVAEQPTTVLIFRDGHRLEIKNYAIVGDELINFSGNGPHRIELADLDVTATTKENDDHGVAFRLPNTVSVKAR